MAADDKKIVFTQEEQKRIDKEVRERLIEAYIKEQVYRKLLYDPPPTPAPGKPASK